MISRLWLSTNPSMASKECCRPPGESTERRDRTSRKRVSRKAKTSTSMAKEFEMGASGYFGSMWSMRRNAVTRPWKKLFRISVNQSCSGMESFYLISPAFPDRVPHFSRVLCARSGDFAANLDIATYRDIQFVGGFAGDGSDGQK